MKLSFSTLGCPQYNIDAIVAMAADNGYDGVELRAVEGTVDLWKLDDLSGGGLARTRGKLRDAGIAVACVGSSASFCVADSARRQAALESAERCIEIAVGLDCPYIRTFGGPIPPLQSYTESIKWSREGYELLCETARKAGITPLLETHDDFSTSAKALDIISGVESRNLGVVWDMLNSYCLGEPLSDTFEKMKDKIRHVHVKDAVNISESDCDLVLIGEGTAPIADCVGILQRGGYDGFYSFEWEKMWHPEIPDPEVAIPHYIKFMRTIN